MDFNYKIEQMSDGKVGITGGVRTTVLSLDQVVSMGIDVHALKNFAPTLYQKAYQMEDVVNAGLPGPHRKRYEFFQELLKQYQETLQTPLRDGTIRLLKELLAELPKDWLGYEYRPAQRFLGTIGVTYGDGDHIELDTSAGTVLFKVAYDPTLREFIRNGYDVERHRRYDMDIDTTLVASVKDATVVALDWLVPWDENAPEVWEMRDSEKLRCSTVVSEADRVFIFVQANVHTDDEPLYRYSEAFISLRRYSPEQLIKVLREQGYLGMADFRAGCGGQINWLHLAELLAEKELLDPRNEERQALTRDQVREKIEKRTGMAMPAARP